MTLHVRLPTPDPLDPDGLAAELARLDALCPAVERQPFTLTTEQFLALRPMRVADRNVFLGTFAHAWEYEQRRRMFWRGAPFLMPAHMEHQLACEWPSIRDEREAEAQRVFNAMQRGDA